MKRYTNLATVRAEIQRKSSGFGTFDATRVAEIQLKSDPIEWWWISSELNPANLLTRLHGPLEDAISLFIEIWSCIHESTF